MSDERGPDLVKTAFKAMWVTPGTGHQILEILQEDRDAGRYNIAAELQWQRAEAVLAALEPHIQQRERCVITTIQGVAEAAVSDYSPPKDAYDRGFADAASFLSDECRRQLRALAAATTDTAADRTEGGA